MYANDIERWISENFKEPARAKAALMQVSSLEPVSLRERVVRCILSLSESDYDSVASWAKKASSDQEYVIGLAEFDNRDLPPKLLKLCEQLSQQFVLAYIEAEFFGGAGTQAHVLFSEGKAIGQPVVSESAINDALRYPGVSKGEAHDEFEAVGLGQHRDTDEWIA